MLLHCDALNPERWKSQRFLSLYQRFDPIDLKRDYAWELAVFMNTKGFLREHFFALFNWPKAMSTNVNRVLDYFNDVPSVHKAAEDNANSITLADGLAWIKATLDANPRYRGSVPLWSQMALNSLFSDENMSAGEISKAMGGLPGVSNTSAINLKFAEWRRTSLFDPLTALPLK